MAVVGDGNQLAVAGRDECRRGRLVASAQCEDRLAVLECSPIAVMAQQPCCAQLVQSVRVGGDGCGAEQGPEAPPWRWMLARLPSKWSERLLQQADGFNVVARQPGASAECAAGPRHWHGGLAECQRLRDQGVDVAVGELGGCGEVSAAGAEHAFSDECCRSRSNATHA
jgi:hypothetical protein